MCVCVVRECGLCHVRHFVTYFLSFVSCVFASFSASLVSGDSSSSSLHVTHTHTLPSACVLVLWLSVSQCLCVCVFQKMLHCFWHARRHRDSLTHAHTQACTQKHTHTYTLLRINQLKKSIWRCHPWVADWRCAVATFVVILWQHL